MVGQRVVDREAEIVSHDQGEWNEVSGFLDRAVLFPGASRRRNPNPTDGRKRAMAVCVPRGFHTPIGAPLADPRGVREPGECAGAKPLRERQMPVIRTPIHL